MQARRPRRDIFACGSGVLSLVWKRKRKMKTEQMGTEGEQFLLSLLMSEVLDWSSREFAWNAAIQSHEAEAEVAVQPSCRVSS